MSVVVTWPTAQDFTTLLTSSGGDARHFLWQMWYVREAVLGGHSPFHTPLLFYPVGISLLTHATGPLVVVTSLPFWSWGPTAAYNGSLIVDVALTGYCAYLLAREVGLRRGEAVFAGLVLLLAEMHLAGLSGHKTKTLMALPPLTLLALHRMARPASGWPWAVGAAALLFLTLLYSGWQFVLTSAAVLFFLVIGLIRSHGPDRKGLLRRCGVFLLAGLLSIAPMILVISRAADTPGIEVDRRGEAIHLAPDLVEFFVPSRYGRSLGPWSREFLEARGIPWTIESTVSLGWTGLLLVSIAAWKAPRPHRPWLLLLLLCCVLALGPTLKVLGRSEFTSYQLPVLLPYALLAELPGLEFARTPGRIMHIGFIALAVCSGFGLAVVTSRFPRRRRLVLTLAAALLLLETWPSAWPRERLREVPEFYEALGEDPEDFGVVDLPLKPHPLSWTIGYSSHYQMYQMVHRKGILLGYISRGYSHNPRIPCLSDRDSVVDDLRVNGTPSDCAEGALHQLATSDYRYVVQHLPQLDYPLYRPGSWGDREARGWIARIFADVAPVFEDELVRVFGVPSPAASLPDRVVLGLGDGWHEREAGFRWARSPAFLDVVSPRRQAAVLEIVPRFLHDPRRPGDVTTEGRLRVEDGRRSTVVHVQAGETAAVPIELSAGRQTVSISLEIASGETRSFRPSDLGSPDARELSFALESIDLKMPSRERARTPDVPTHVSPGLASSGEED